MNEYPIPKPNEFIIAICRASLKYGIKGNNSNNSAYTQYVYFPYIRGYFLDSYNIPKYAIKKNENDNK